ncbi:MAG: hypothetical protein M3443_09110 [Actinomycetota bacterium]|nr:hypothetical protein [Actinomycetota bacterium]
MGNKGGGFDYDPEAVRGFAAVFAEAQKQVQQIKVTLGDTSAKRADFGRSWGEHGAEFEQYMKALADDLANLGTHLGEITTKLGQGTDLVVRSDTSGYSNLKTIQDRMDD